MARIIDVNRRTFLKGTAATMVGLAVAGAPRTQAAGANEKLNIGLIGTGGRCRDLMKALARVKHARMAAVCDIYDHHLELGRQIADPSAFSTKEYREILNRKDIDAVLIATPDHWHVPMTIDACAAGKDVYVEKPLTHNLGEGAAVIEAQNKHNRIVQVGMQQRSMPQFQKAREIIRSGAIGKVHKVHLSWNRNIDQPSRPPLGVDPRQVNWKAFLGNAPDQPFNELRFRSWRWFWDFGNGILGDLMVHFIDVVHWFFDVDHPLKATTVGEHYWAKDLWETPDTIQTMLVYPNELQVYFEGTFINARNAAMLEFMGRDATLYVDRGRYEIIPEKGKRSAEQWILGTGPKGQDFYDKPDGELLHLTNWVECIKSRKRPNAPAEAGVGASAAAHLGNIALRGAKIAEWGT
jgi:predicted dehydrogenase